MEEFNSAWVYLNMLYGVELDLEDFEEIGLIAWNKIGNKQSKLYKITIDTDCENNEVTLPCNCDQIQAVTSIYGDWNSVTNDTHNGDYNSQFTENYVEGLKLNNSPYYMPGKYIKYERVGDKLYFHKPYGKVLILYKGVLLDDNGLPYINNKEKDAIACFCAYISKFKEGLATHNLALLTESLLLELKWLKLCDEARVPEYITENEMDLILDARTNWNRKIFNKSYKPIH